MMTLMITSESSAEDLGHDHHNPHVKTDTESDSEQETDFWLLSQTHTVTLIFKCIGVTYDFHAQEILRKVSMLPEQEV